MSDATPHADSEGSMSRRDFNILAVAAGVTVAAGPAEAAVPVAQRNVDIRTPDGVTDAVLVHPAGTRKSPAVILYPDAFGLRPAMVDMAKRLAGHGYAVLVVNQFYRVRRAPVFPPGFSFSNPDDRAQLMKLMAALDHDAVTKDATAFIAFADAQPEVNARAKMGAVGFCMGGAMTIRAAAARPDRLGACASFHGGSLVTDAATSPHKLVAGTKASYHIGIAADDDAKEPGAKTAMAEALTAAKRPHSVDVYPDSKHGWTVPDSAAYDQPQAERAWTAMLALYQKALV